MIHTSLIDAAVLATEVAHARADRYHRQLISQLFNTYHSPSSNL
jgi:hypothetical protein